MGLITINYNKFESVAKIIPSYTGNIFITFADVFDDKQGNLPGIAHFEIDPTVTPVTSTAVRVPISFKNQVKTELNKLNLSTELDFEHRTTSPYNSKAESAVKTAKSLLRKNREQYQFLALFNYRNTPSQVTGTSHVQRFFNSRTRTLLPTSQNLLQSSLNMEAEKTKLLDHHKKQAKQYNRNAIDLPPLEEGDLVRMKPFQMGEKKWSKGIVTKRLDERSYKVKVGDTVYRRNRVHLKNTPEFLSSEPTRVEPVEPLNSTNPNELPVVQDDVNSPAIKSPCKSSSPAKTGSEIPVRTRSGRVVKTPTMTDFVKC